VTSNFTVLWNADTEERLVELWLDSDNRSGVAAAIHRVDTLLRFDPIRLGDELHEGLYCLEVAPLRVLYEVSEEDRLVRVVAVSLAQT
jgi:hypothetical protein